MVGCLIKIVDVLIDALLFNDKDCRAQAENLIQFIAAELIKGFARPGELWHGNSSGFLVMLRL